ncbi:unnamed protein product [Linum trigynum]|uniref:Uncharacterized protein n=1 Tax=Linum trigynum TaxID=586398 RepID=A0AAV2F1G2_9ROSI
MKIGIPGSKSVHGAHPNSVPGPDGQCGGGGEASRRDGRGELGYQRWWRREDEDGSGFSGAEESLESEELKESEADY